MRFGVAAQPFPTSDVFRTLPSRESILRGILNADLVGFHTFDYARHFLSACRRCVNCIQYTPCIHQSILLCLDARDASYGVLIACRASLCCTRILDLDFQTEHGGAMSVNYGGRPVTIRISHVGIVSDQFAKVAASEQVKRRVQEIK